MQAPAREEERAGAGVNVQEVQLRDQGLFVSKGRRVER